MGVWIMAGVTFREAPRKKVLWMALVAGAGFLTLFGTGLHFQVKDLASQSINPVLRREIMNTMLTMGLYAVDLLAVLMTILTSVDTLSGEITSGTIQAVATKPVSRRQVLLGKWFGFVAMITTYIIIMVGGVNAVTYFIGGVTARCLFAYCAGIEDKGNVSVQLIAASSTKMVWAYSVNKQRGAARTSSKNQQQEPAVYGGSRCQAL
jgi:ABC-type transport system involved in multi-copper enzyme maturation permease subunit